MKKCRVLLLGDSISMGYREKVKHKLVDWVDIVYPNENGKFAAYTYRMIYEWAMHLNIDKNVDMVYWNNGLWDVVRIYGEEPQTDIKAYEVMLERCYKRFQYLFPNAKIVFATTTTIIEERYDEKFFRCNEDIRKYNDVAIRCINRLGGVVDCLHEVTMGLDETYYEDATHFNEMGNIRIVEHVCSVILNNMDEVIERYSRERCEEIPKMKECIENILRNKQSVVIWGCGETFRLHIAELMEWCNIVAVCDSDVRLQGTCQEGLLCVSPDEINQYSNNVIITAERQVSIDAISDRLQKLELNYCLWYDIWGEIALIKEREIIRDLFPNGIPNKAPHQKGIFKKYIGLHVPVNECNLRCNYCYLSQRSEKQRGISKIMHWPQYIRLQLSQEKVGGEALIGLCGAGETLMCDKFAEICVELLREGHYLHIVTNGLLTSKIVEIIESAGEYAEHVFFKLSFHYEQLKEKGLLQKFVENVNIIQKSEASYTIELMPYDELIPYIEEIKEFSMREFGALPHLTIGRDDSKQQTLLTKLSFEEYREVWSSFDSELFSFKLDYYMCQTQGCHAGKYSIYINLLNGGVSRCLGQPIIANLYDENFEVDFPAVDNECLLSYCYNCHAYVAMGDMPHIEAPTYLELRDRVMQNGEHWIKKAMREFLGQKLYRNN